jgi:transcription factor Sp
VITRCAREGCVSRLLTPLVSCPALLQEVQPSPLALLAATCSKIGAPPPPSEDGTNQNGSQTPVRVLPNPATGGGEPIQIQAPSWVQVPAGAVQIDPTGKQQQQTVGVPVALQQSQIFQQQAAAPQIIATPGPGGTLSYNVIPPFQTVNIDGQEAVFIPASMTGSGGQSILGGNQTYLTPQGQIIRAQTAQPQGQMQQMPASNVFPSNMGFANLAGSQYVNIGGNVVNLSGALPNTVAVRPNIANNMVQTVQIPMSQMNQFSNAFSNFIQIPVTNAQGQTTMQTIQVPMQASFPMAQQQVTAVPTTTASGQTGQPQTLTIQPQQSLQMQAQTAQIVDMSGNAQTPTSQSDSKPSTPQLPQSAAVTTQNATIQNISQQMATSAASIPTAAAAAANIIPASAIPGMFPMSGANILSGPGGQTFIPVSQAPGANGQTYFTVASLPQDGTTSSTTDTTTTSTASSTAAAQQQAAQQAATLSSIITPQALMQAGAFGAQGIQLAGQNQVLAAQNPWLSAINLANMRAASGTTLPGGMQPIQVQVQNLQGIQNLQAFQAIQGVQGFQAITPQGQVLGNATLQNLGPLAVQQAGSGSIAAMGGMSQSEQHQQSQIQTIQSLAGQQVISTPTPSTPTISAAQIIGK